MLTVPPGVFPGDPLAVTWEGAEYEVLAPEGVAAGESFEFELLPAPRPVVRAVARPAPPEYAASEATRDSDRIAAAPAALTTATAGIGGPAKERSRRLPRPVQ